MKRILFLSETWVMGGREKTVKLMVENFPREDMEPELLIIRHKDIAERERRFGSPPLPLNTKVTFIEGDSFFTLLYSLTKFLRRNRPHLISTHILSTSTLFLLVFLAHKLAHPRSILVPTVHNTYLDFPTDNWKRKISLPLRKYIIQKVEHWITVSKGLRELLASKLAIPKEKITPIYNPIVGRELFEGIEDEPEEFKSFPNGVKILTVARLDTSSKDFKTLISAFSLLVRRYKEALLFVVGEGPDREKITRWIEELGLKDRAFLLGARLNPYPYFRHADIFVLSSFREGLGRVIVEAMALGCPVVATDCPVGPRELIVNNENGILVPMKDPTKMAEAMMRILEDKGLRERLIENGKRKAEEFSISASVKRRVEVFKKLLEAKGIRD